jgi:6,7-dimethyl-8-ribityllumazine synthase
VATSISSSPSPTFSFNDQHYIIGVVTASWNHHITGVLQQGAIDVLTKAQSEQSIEIIEFAVPGAFEIPTAAQWLFENGCDAVINLGCVIKGDTPHFDYVCNAVTEGIAQLALKHSKPCIFGIITTNNEQQAFDRAGGSLGNKGAEAAEAALWMLLAKSSLES